MSGSPRHRGRRLIGGIVVLVALSAPSFAAGQSYKYATASFGLRHSFGIGAPGYDFRVGMGAGVGAGVGLRAALFGAELELGWTSDKTWATKELRTAARSHAWLSLQVTLRPAERVSLTFGGGPGLGWIKSPPVSEPIVRYPSQGLHEYVQLGFFLGQPMGLFQLGIRFEPQQLWQSHVIDGVDHALCARLVFHVGELREAWE